MASRKKQRMKINEVDGVAVMDLGAIEIWDGADLALLRETLYRLVDGEKRRAVGVNMTFVKYVPSGFFGMLVVTPLGYLIQLRFGGPPATVTFLPSFWLLVPGALSLSSVTRMLSDREAGVDGLVTAVFVFTSIALGTLMGAALYKQLTERFGAWQLQLGRVGRYFRRNKREEGDRRRGKPTNN